jgi:hypothetical protein
VSCTEYEASIDGLSQAERQGHRSGSLHSGGTREPDVVFITAGKAMTYRVSYEDGLATTTGAEGREGVTRTEYFHTEHAALKRARQLLADGAHQAVSLSDGAGGMLVGILLELKLGAAMVD